LNKNFNKGVFLLHFGAVDSICDLYVNGNHLGHHEGGYNAFSVDITTSLLETDNHLVVRVRDFTDKSYHTNGKQSSRRGGMWYTPQSGI
ncbi:MAG: glycoside hydrolase family 2, partial [Clostridia bacterium]|nr:glycoside hydrolase family 2 [Clostridia bacterium]